ncbi:hypothetical protein A2335_01950 [Candidatus Peregrinibacteria bacterium RIFOXYB2_FULL_32_7]|nr:MAG: hypothetical protein A2335_01950 [Candidatus Peregrinibacteria bacterium RIFOXYB2_FULL_32_7]
MPQIIYEIIGFGGSCIVAFGHLPQIIHLFKKKDSTGVSLFAWLIWVLGDILLLIYSISILDKVFIFLNSLNSLFAIIIVGVTIWYRWRR